MNKRKNSAFLRSVAVLVSGNAVAAAINFGFSPILTRLYSPEDFGILQLYVSVTALFTVVATLRFELAIPLPKTHKDGWAVARTALLASVVIAVLTGVLTVFVGGSVSSLLNAELLTPYLWTAPFAVITWGILQTGSMWGVRLGRYNVVAAAKTVSSSTSIFFMVLVGWVHASPLGLILGPIVGRVFATGWLAKLLHRERPGPSELTPRGVVKRYRRFATHSIPSAFLDSLGIQLPVIIIAMHHNAHLVGLIAVVRRIADTPVLMMVSGVQQVYYRESANIGKENPALQRQLLKSLVTKLALLASPVVLCAFVDFRPIIAFLFGDAWGDASDYLRIWGPAYFAAIVAAPSASLFDVMERQDLHLVREAVKVSSGALVCAATFYFDWSALITFGAFGLVSAFGYVLNLALALWLLRPSAGAHE